MASPSDYGDNLLNRNETADVIIQDKLDDHVEFRAASDNGTYNAETHTVTWTLKDVEALTEGSVTVTIRVLESAEEVGQIENTAAVKIGNDEAVKTNTVKNPLDEEPTPTPEPTPDNEPGEPKKYVDADGDEDFDDSLQEVKVGDELTYMIRYYNHHAEEEAVTITDTLESNLEYVEGSASDGGIYDGSTRTITWVVDAKALSYGSVTFKAKVLSGAESAGKIANTATVKIDSDAPQETNEVENPVETTSGDSNPTGSTTGTGSTPSSTTTPTSSTGSGGTGSSGGATSTVKTADETPVGLMAGLMLAALAVMLAAFTYRRRRTSNK